MGSHLSLLISLSSLTNAFLIPNSLMKSAFFFARNFYIDGWGGMDGMVVDGRSTIFLAHILKTTCYFFLTVSGPLDRGFSKSFAIFSEKNRNVLFSKKICQNKKNPFFFLIFISFSQISRKLLKFFSDWFWSPYYG